jgi:hypothetical protein
MFCQLHRALEILTDLRLQKLIQLFLRNQRRMEGISAFRLLVSSKHLCSILNLKNKNQQNLSQ